LFAQPSTNPDVGTGSDLVEQQFKAIKREQVLAVGKCEDAECASDAQAQATILGSRRFIIQQDQWIGQRLCQDQCLGLSWAEDDGGCVSEDQWGQYVHDRARLTLPEQTHSECVWSTSHQTLRDDLVVHSTGNLHLLVQIRQEIKSIQLAQDH
jgi:hypothetical protein